MTRGRPILGAFLSNVALGLIPAMLAMVFAKTTLKDLAQTGFDGIVYANCIGMPAWWAVPRIMGRLQARSRLINVAAIMGILILCSAVGCVVANLILASMGLVQMSEFGRVLGWTLRICLLISLSFGLLTTLITSLQDRLRDTVGALREKELAEARALQMAAEARFASLESRVHPHFLFNTLNTISTLVREDPAEAERTIERLAALIRFSLDSELAGLVALSEELRVVKDYLEIEKVRFGDRLRYSFQTEPGTESRQVPPLAVQTLVENSMKYAVGVRREGAEITIRSRLIGQELHVEVSDDGPGFDLASSMKPGHGLDLLRQRLTGLFGKAASLEMSSANGLTRIEISVAA